jgi:hypothetical protein
MDLLDKAAISEGDDSFSKISEKSGDLENEDHIFFGCIMARSVFLPGGPGGGRVPYNLQDFFDEWLPLNCNKYHVKFFFCFAMVLWSI